jgi:hypothetical protein
MVLAKSMEKSKLEGKEIYLKITDMILETCKVILLSHEEFRKGVAKSVVDFYTSAEFRTADIVPSI